MTKRQLRVLYRDFLFSIVDRELLSTHVFVKSPRGQQLGEVPGAETWLETSVPLLVSSIVMMAFAVLAGRLAFAMPRDLQSNWIFRVVGQSRSGVARRGTPLGAHDCLRCTGLHDLVSSSVVAVAVANGARAPRSTSYPRDHSRGSCSRGGPEDSMYVLLSTR